MSYSTLADDLDLTLSTIDRYVAGKVSPSVETLNKLLDMAHAAGIPEAEITFRMALHDRGEHGGIERTMLESLQSSMPSLEILLGRLVRENSQPIEDMSRLATLYLEMSGRVNEMVERVKQSQSK